MLHNLTISKRRNGMYPSFTKSRRDGALLTVGFNLRIEYALHTIQSPAGTTQTLSQPSMVETDNYPSLHLNDGLFRVFRRLKPTVNRVPSLRDLQSNMLSDTNFEIDRLNNINN